MKSCCKTQESLKEPRAKRSRVWMVLALLAVVIAVLGLLERASP
jgi:hypothetical protein